MVAEEARSKGLGGTIMRLTLAHMLLEENLLAIAGARVVAHVVEGNLRPLGIIKDALRFRYAGSVKIPADELPGLRSRDGFVYGDEFELQFPETVLALAQWAEAWNGHLNGSTAHVELRNGVSMTDWAAALRAIAATGPQS
jgi:hypothetical protein